MIFNKVVKVSAAAGASGYVDAYTVKHGQKFKLQRVMFIFPSGAGGLLGLAVVYGTVQVCPDEGLARGDNVNFSLSDDSEFKSGDTIKIYYKNDDAANAHEAYVIIEGELTSGG